MPNDRTPVPDKNVAVNGTIIGASSTVKMSVKTTLWILGAIVGVVMTILTYSYFDLKKDYKNDFKEFVESVDGKVDAMGTDITNIRIGNASIKGDIKLILDRQSRDNPVKPTNTAVQPTIPPPMTTTVTQPDTTSN